MAKSLKARKKAAARRALKASLPFYVAFDRSSRRLLPLQEQAYAAWARTLSDTALRKIVSKEASAKLLGRLSALSFLYDSRCPLSLTVLTRPQAQAFSALKELNRRNGGNDVEA